MRGTTRSVLIWVILIGIMTDSQGAAERPIVIFNPNWAKVFTGESITMTCYTSLAHQNQSFSWYKDDEQLSVNDQTYTISYTRTGHTGNYQCGTTVNEISGISRLEVIYGYLILQVPPFVYEGDDVPMRCYSWPGYSIRRTMFFKDNAVIRPLKAETNLIIDNVNKDAAGTYKCVKKSESSFETSYTDESPLYVKDLFSSPEVNQTLYPVTQGDNLILTCDTVLSPLRQETQLHFAFYKDGQYVQRFSLSNQYEVLSAQLEDIGKYSCEVKTSSSTVRKMSKAIDVQIQDLFQTTEIRLTPYPMVEGDHMTLMCYTSLSPLKQTELHFAFYKEGRSVQTFSSSNQHGDRCAQLEDSGNYSCEVKAINNNIKKTSKELYVVTQELFSKPYITAIPYPMVEEDHMALICNTSLSPIRQETHLLFAFYRDGWDVQGFSLSDQYEVHLAQLEDSGNYSCEVKTSANSVKKTSEEINIRVQGTKYRRYKLMNITRLVAAFVVYVACCFIAFKYC